MKDDPFLYRALRPEEIERGALKPRLQTQFVAHPMLPQTLPFNLGETVEHAIREQQWDSKKFPTSGVSTTPLWHRAQHYATTNHKIAVIRIASLAEAGVQSFRVADHLRPEMIHHPEDDEVI